MPATLQEILLAPDTKPSVQSDCYTLIQQEVSELSGISGTAVKVAYKTVTTFAAGHVQVMIESLLPRMVEQLEPFWTDFGTAGGADFGDYLSKRGGEVADALLVVTDERAESSERPTLIRAYRSVRGGAAKHIQAALPRVGDLVLKYTG